MLTNDNSYGDSSVVEQYKEPTSLEKRIAFNSFNSQNGSIWERVWDLYLKLGIFQIPGNILEVGAGKGNFWREAQTSILKHLLAEKIIYLTDLSEGMLKDLQITKKELTDDHDHMVVEKADAKDLSSYKDKNIAVSFYQFVLYTVFGATAKTSQQIDTEVEHAVKEASQTILPEGSVVVMTMDEKIHMKELYEILHELDETIPLEAPAILPFCKSNAEPMLSKFFNKVDAYSFPNKLMITPKHPQDSRISGVDATVEYVKSLSFAKNKGDDFFVALRQKVENIIKEKGQLDISRDEIVYICQQPKL